MNCVILLVLVGMAIPFAFADDNVKFIIDDYAITVNSPLVSEISLNWSPVHNLPEGTITLSEPHDGIIEMNIPKSMPRTMNLDFGTELVVEGHGIKSGDIYETESECFYNVQFHFKNSDYLEFGTMSLAAGRWEPVSILNQSCGEFSLKQQIENNMPVLEIECKNEKHVLAERPNGKIACVYPETAKHLKWDIYTNIVLNEVSSNADVSSYYDKKSLETKFCTANMIEFLDKNSNIFDNNEPYSSPLDGDVLQGLNINPDDMVQCENELYENRNK